MNRVGFKTKYGLETRGVHRVKRRLPLFRKPKRRPRSVRPGGYHVLLAVFVDREQGEIRRIARDPVRHDEDPGQDHLHRLRRLRKRHRGREARLLQRPSVQIPSVPPL